MSPIDPMVSGLLIGFGALLMLFILVFSGFIISFYRARKDQHAEYLKRMRVLRYNKIFEQQEETCDLSSTGSVSPLDGAVMHEIHHHVHQDGAASNQMTIINIMSESVAAAADEPTLNKDDESVNSKSDAKSWEHQRIHKRSLSDGTDLKAQALRRHHHQNERLSNDNNKKNNNATTTTAEPRKTIIKYRTVDGPPVDASHQPPPLPVPLFHRKTSKSSSAHHCSSHSSHCRQSVGDYFELNSPTQLMHNSRSCNDSKSASLINIHRGANVTVNVFSDQIAIINSSATGSNGGGPLQSLSPPPQSSSNVHPHMTIASISSNVSRPNPDNSDGHLPLAPPEYEVSSSPSHAGS